MMLALLMWLSLLPTRFLIGPITRMKIIEKTKAIKERIDFQHTVHTVRYLRDITSFIDFLVVQRRNKEIHGFSFVVLKSIVLFF